MPALDTFHHAVKNALVKNGWTITHDPLHLPLGGRNTFVDLGAEQLIAADKGTRKIAVEIKTFMGRSEMADLEQAVGQYVIYGALLQALEPDRTLYVAIPEDVLNTFFQEAIVGLVRKVALSHLVSYDPVTEEIIRWLPEAEAQA